MHFFLHITYLSLILSSTDIHRRVPSYSNSFPVYLLFQCPTLFIVITPINKPITSLWVVLQPRNVRSRNTTHCTKKWSFPLRISSVKVTKSAWNCGFDHIYWRNFKEKPHFLCSDISKHISDTMHIFLLPFCTFLGYSGPWE